jgi:hypothetical protein
MQDISILKKVLKNPQGVYDIAIQISFDGVSYSVLVPNQNLILGIRHIPIKGIGREDDLAVTIGKNLFKEQALKVPYNSVKIAYISKNSTLVPADYFDANNLKKFLDLNHALDELDEIHYNFIPAINAYNIFTVPNVVANELINFFPNMKLYHQATPLITSSVIYNKNKSASAAEAYIHLNHDFFDFLFYKDNQFILHNSYELRSEADFVYYVLAALKQLNVEPANAVIKLSGLVQEKKQFIDALFHFAANVDVIIDLPQLYRDKALRKIPAECFVALNGLFLCE